MWIKSKIYQLKVADPLKGMWYLRKVGSSCEQFGPVSTCLCPKYIRFCQRNVREDKNEIR